MTGSFPFVSYLARISRVDMDGCMDGCMYGWMYVWMDGWMDGCMYVWMYGCMDVHTQSKKHGNLMEMELPYLEILMWREKERERERERDSAIQYSIFFSKKKRNLAKEALIPQFRSTTSV